MPPYDILKCENMKELSQEEFDPKNIKDNFYGLQNYPPKFNQTGARKSDVLFCLNLATLRHLGFDPGSCDIDRFVAEGAKISADYFTGEYLLTDDKSANSMRKAADNTSLPWFETYRRGLLLSFMADDEASEQCLVDWIEPWLPFDDGPNEVTPYDNTYHKLLAEHLAGDMQLSEDLFAEIQGCKKKPPKLLFDGLVAIRNGDAEQLSKSIVGYLNHFLKNQFSNGGITSYFSLEASIQHHVAERAGLKVTGLNDKQQALIMTRNTLGFSG